MSQLNGIFICRLIAVLLTQDNLTKTSSDWLRDKDGTTTTGHGILPIMQDTRCFVLRAIAFIKEHKTEREKVKVTNFCSSSLDLAVSCSLGYGG